MSAPLRGGPPAGVVGPKYGCLTLTTDYGYEAGFVGVLHAVAFAIAPSVRVIDLDHRLPPQDVRLGALRLERFMAIAPSGVHVGIVDPGVGGSRRAVAISAGSHSFVGPDNGLLAWAADACGGDELRVVELDRPEFWLERRSRTFDGRDIFVPVAAHLAQGLELAEIGTPVDPGSLFRLDRPRCSVATSGAAELEVLQVDGFGNIQLSGNEEIVVALGLGAGDNVELTSPGTAPVRATFGKTFSDVPVDHPIVLIDSDGCLALSVNYGSAAAIFDAKPAAPVRLSRA